MRSRRRSVASLALFGVVASAVGVGTVANFSDTETTPGNRFTAGTLDLTTSPRTQAWRVDNVAPGDTEYRTITVGNAGSLPLEYDADAVLATQADGAAATHPGSPANGGLGEVLGLTYRGVVSDDASCGPSSVAATTLSGFLPSTPQAIDLLNPTRVLASGASEKLCFSFQLPLSADNRYQADSADFTFTFNSRQAGRDAANQPVAAAVGAISPTAAPSDSKAVVSYSSVTGADHYTVRVAPQDGTAAWTVAATGSPMTITGLTNRTSYKFVVRAYSGARIIAQGSTAAVTPASTPAAVENLAATVPADGSMTATWSPSSDALSAAATGYDVTVATEAGTVVSTTLVTAATYTATGLATAPKYVISVVPRNVSGVGPSRSTAPLLAYLAPPSLTGLTPVASGLSGVAKVAFDRPSGSQVTAVELTALGEDGTSATTTAAGNATSATFAGLSPNVRYRVQAQARNAVGASPVTTTAYFSLLTVPNPVSNLSALSSGAGSIAASWTASTADAQHDSASSYDITLSRGGSVVRTASVTTASASFTGLPSGTGYTLSVVAKNAAGAASAVSTTAEAGGYMPAAPTAVTGTPSAGGGLTVAWTGSVVDATHDPAASYVVELSNGSTVVKTVTVTAASTSFTGLPSGSTYTASVRAVNAAGTSPVATASVTAGAYAPNAPTNLTSTVGSNGVISAAWTASAVDATHDAATSYRTRLLKGATLVQDTSSTTTTMAFAPVGAGSYTVEIAAINSAGTGPVITSAATVSSAYTPTVMADAPLAYLKLDDASAPVVDSSGNGKNGVAFGTMSYRQAPLVSDSGYSVGFTRDTGSSINLPTLPANTGTTEFNTMESWADFTTMDPSRPYYLYQMTRGYHLIAFKGCLGFNTGGGDVYGVPMSTISSGTHHVAAVFANHTRNSSKLYIDGVQQTLSSCYGGAGGSGPDYVTGDDISLSTKYDAGNASWPSKVDNFAVYSGALSAARVQAHYNAGK